MKIVITAGGTGGHIFPALAVALELRKQCEALSLLWIGTSRSREKELGAKNGIEVKVLDVSGINKKWSFSALAAIKSFVLALFHMVRFFSENRPDAVVAFGGYVCAPVLTAAMLRKIPWFLQEQNSVPGKVNRLFSKGAVLCFLGYPVSGTVVLKGRSEVTGNPVRVAAETYEGFKYPGGFVRGGRTVLISGGSQGAASMNDCLIEPVKRICDRGIQVIWQTGAVSYEKIRAGVNAHTTAFIFEAIDDLYPYYAVSNIVICRSGASTLSEVAYFGLPCITIPLPWAADNHQWANAGYVECKEWGFRIAQAGNTGVEVEKAVDRLLTDKKLHETMSKKALDDSPAEAASRIAEKILCHLKGSGTNVF